MLPETPPPLVALFYYENLTHKKQKTTPTKNILVES